MRHATEQQKREVLSRYAELKHLGVVKAAKEIGVPKSSLQDWIKSPPPDISYGQPLVTPTHSFPAFPEDDLPVEEIIAMRKREFEQKRAREEAAKLIPIQIKIDGPIGILHFGDPHLDDDGTDIGEAFRHAELTRTVDGLFGANVGDTTNAWVGRMARLYAEQNMGRARALKVAEHFVKSARWLYMVGGNHDGWAGADDPIKWIAGQSKAAYMPSEARLCLKFPAGDSLTINARHDFSGHSQWNPAHGVMKSIQMGAHDELSTCGHRHVSGYGVLKHPQDGTVCHAVQIASYKRYDRYAKEKGFRDQHLSPCALTVIDPLLPRTNPDRIKVFWDADEGVDYLRFKRNK